MPRCEESAQKQHTMFALGRRHAGHLHYTMHEHHVPRSGATPASSSATEVSFSATLSLLGS